MCGIAGFNISREDHRQIDCRDLARCLVTEIMARGTDATGAAWSERGDDGQSQVWYAKDAVPATAFLTSIKQLVPKYSRNVILHTRYATKGDPATNANNHPICVPGVVGVHNGHISNDDEVIASLGVTRDAEVDSEAAMHLIAHSPDPAKALGKLRGRAALAWIRTATPNTLHLARVEGSPLVVAQTPGGSTIFASTMVLLAQAVERAKVQVDYVYDVPEYTYLRISDGLWTDMRDIDYVAPPARLTHSGIGPAWRHF